MLRTWTAINFLPPDPMFLSIFIPFAYQQILSFRNSPFSQVRFSATALAFKRIARIWLWRRRRLPSTKIHLPYITCGATPYLPFPTDLPLNNKLHKVLCIRWLVGWLLRWLTGRVATTLWMIRIAIIFRDSRIPNKKFKNGSGTCQHFNFIRSPSSAFNRAEPSSLPRHRRCSSARSCKFNEY